MFYSKALKYSLFCGVSLLTFSLSSPLLANPEGGQVVSGSATIQATGNKLDVHQHTGRAIIDWRSFNIDVNEHTQFHQPSSNSTVLNRVKTADPSQILGKLSANGNVILINPNGVFFGADSKVDVNGLVVTTADIKNQDFNAGKLHFNQAGNPNASIVNNGTITAKEAGLVGLVAPNVINNGLIQAKLGHIELASGDTFILDLYGDGIIGLEVSDEVKSQLLHNTGKIDAEGGDIILTAAAGKNIVNSLVKIEGELKAPSVSQKNGKIIISAKGRNAVENNVQADKGKKQGKSEVFVDAKIDVSGKGENQTGGDVSVLGDFITVRQGTVIDASGQNGGGNILIGGDYFGSGETPNALRTFVESGVIFNADATENGDGGKVVVWADELTKFFGKIFARGGDHSGNGGFVEVSGKKYLTFKGDVDTTALNGETGLLLLDPTNIIIANGSGDSAADGTNTFAGDISGAAGTIDVNDLGPTTIYETELEGIASTTNISLAASNAITINNLTDNNLNLAQTAGRSVTFTAGAGGVNMNAGDTITTAGGALNIITTAAGAATLGGIATNGGLVTLNAEGNVTTGIISGSGGLTKLGAGILTLSTSNTYSGLTTLSAGTTRAGHNNAFGTSTVVLDGGTLQAVTASRTLTNAIRLNANSTISGSVALTMNGALTNYGADNTLTISNSGGTTFGGAVNLSESTTDRTLTINNTANTTIGGVIQKGGGGATTSGFTKAGTGTLTVNGNNTYTGATTLTAGTLVAGHNNAIGGGLLVFNGGGLNGSAARIFNNDIRVQGATNTIGGTASLTFNGAMTNYNGNRTLNVNNTGGTTFAGAVNLSESGTARTFTIGGTGNLTMSGVVDDGASTSNLVKTGTNTLTLSNSNTYNGTTTQSGGTIVASNNTALGSGLFIFNGGTLNGTGTRTFLNDIRLAANGTISGNSNLTFNGLLTNYAGNRTLTVDNAGSTTFNGNVNLSNDTTNRTLTIGGAGNTTIGGIIQKGGGGTAASTLTKTGTGTLSLSGTNTYTGATTINGGTLKLTGINSISNSSAVTVGASGTFDLNGLTETVASVTNSGTVALGTNGSLTTTGAQTHTGIVTGNNATLASSGTGAISATNVSNNFTGDLDVSTGGAIDIINDGDLSLGAVSGTLVRAESLNGDLIVNGQVQASTTSGTTISLKGERFINNVGASALQTTGTGRFLVFSDDSRDDTRNSLTGFNRYGCSYSAGTPSCAGTTNIPTSGNGFYTVYAPTLSITGVTAQNRIYDATDVATLAGTAVVSGFLNGDTTTLNTSGATALFNDKNVANNKAVTVSGYTLNGLDQGYLLDQPTGLSANVTPYDIEVTGLTASNKIYDTNTVATLGGTAAVAALLSDNLSLLGTAAGVFNNKNVANNKAVTVSGLTLGGTDALNYNLIQQTGLTADITQRDIEVSGLTASNKIYDTNTIATLGGSAAVTALGLDNLSLLGTGVGNFNNKNVGNNKAVTVSGYTLGGTDALNYNLIQQTGLTADITPRDVSVTGLTAANRIYNADVDVTLGGTAAVAALGLDDLVLNGTGVGAFNDKNVGNGKIVNVSGYTLGGADALNYNLLQQTGLTANVTQRDIMVSGLTASNKVYNGNTLAALGGTAAVTALLTDDLSLLGTGVANFDNKNVGNGKTVTVSGYTLSGADALNYNLLQQTGLSADVTPRALTVASIVADDKLFNNTTDAVISSYSFDDAVGGDNIFVSGIAGLFDTADIGKDKTVTISSGSLTGTDAGNYSFTLGGATTLADITGELPSTIQTGDDLPTTVSFTTQISTSNFIQEIFNNTDQSVEGEFGDRKLTVSNQPTFIGGLLTIDSEILELFELEDEKSL